MGAVTLLHNFRYTTLLSECDSQKPKHLCDLNVYPAVPINKEECVNHVAKRMGTALRKLASEGKKAGTTLGGRLTQATITKLTGYSIRSHPGDTVAMRHAVFATFFHAASTDEEPHHNHCPVGRDSWCFFQQALAMEEEPGPQCDNVGTPLSKDVAEHVKDVYVRLGHPELNRCHNVKTQSSNGFVGLDRVRWTDTCLGGDMCCGCRVQPGGRVDGGPHLRCHGDDKWATDKTLPYTSCLQKIKVFHMCAVN